MEEYINIKCSGILSAINSAKRSILYDVEKRINEVKNTVVANRVQQVPSTADLKEKLGTPLPITTIENFLEFEETIKNSGESKKALVSILK